MELMEGPRPKPILSPLAMVGQRIVRYVADRLTYVASSIRLIFHVKSSSLPSFHRLRQGFSVVRRRVRLRGFHALIVVGDTSLSAQTMASHWSFLVAFWKDPRTGLATEVRGCLDPTPIDQVLVLSDHLLANPSSVFGAW
jgi:hypothetical protein